MNFMRELKRRNVIRMGGLYLVGAWLLVQVASTLFPAFGVLDWALRALVIVLAIGFIPALGFAWAFELTPDGIKRDEDIDPAQSIAPQTAQRMNRLIIATLVLALTYFGFDKFLLAPRREAANLALRTKSIEAMSAATDDRSIAVLPLANESGDKDQQYFSDGLSDDLINALMQFGNLKVIGRTSAFQFRDSKESSAAIGAKLGVAYLLTGSVRKLGDTVRINAQLVKAADGSGVWSHSYDRPYTDLFKLQDEITAAVAGALKAKLLQGSDAAAQNDRPPSGNLAAYNAYQRGLFYVTRGNQPDLLAALEHLREAIRLDPDYAAAWVAISVTQTNLARGCLTGADIAPMLAQAQASADAALRLNPALPQAHSARALVIRVRDLDFNGALAESRRALELAPNDTGVMSGYAANLAIQGKTRDAISLIRQAQILDPLDAGSRTALVRWLAAIGSLSEAKAAIDEAVELQPGSEDNLTTQARIETMRGDIPAALAIARTRLSGVRRDLAMAAALQNEPDRAAADAALRTLIDKHADELAYKIADLYAQRRDADNAFKWLDRAWDNRESNVAYILQNPYLLRFRDDPRFAAFATKVGLPTTTDAKALP